jgi:SAM-dependent methyltransferase
MVNPTLHCPCNGQFRQRVAEYNEPPAIETALSTNGKPYWRAYDRCNLCSHYFGVHDFDLAALYEGDYVDASYRSADGMREKFEKIIALPSERSDNYWRVERIDEYGRNHFGGAPRVLTLLDVGTGLGVFPAGMKKAGWKCSAIDPDPRAAEHVRTGIGLTAFAGDFLKIPDRELGRYHVITFNKVLEHVEDPVVFLEKAARHIVENGLIYIELPDVAAATDPDGHNREEFCIEHYHVFSPASIVLLAERAGFEILSLTRFREPSTKYTLAAFARPRA